tara:strand:- start:314 stop:1078 length:765 start_codon:yes stop_codon:yes gene_type:complete
MVTPSGISDENLAVYWKFNETESPIFNSSLSSSSIGNTSSTGQGIMTGGSFEQTGRTGAGEIPTSVLLFDGVDDSMQAGSTESLWNFLSNSDAIWSMAFWMKGVDLGWDDYFLANTDGTQDQGLRIRLDGQTTYSGFNFVLRSDGNSIINASLASANYIPDLNWHFYCFTCDLSLGSNNLVARRDNSNQETLSKSGGSTADGDADYVPTMAKKTGGSANYGNFLIGQMSIWSGIVLSDDAQDQLYNSGLGQEIY